MRREGYRLKHVAVNIAHDDPDTYGSEPVGRKKDKGDEDDRNSNTSSEEDDLDVINMDIYQDLVNSGKDLLEAYENVRDSRRK